MSRSMSLADDSTPRLWRDFMPRRHEITNRVSSDVVSMRVYGGRPGSLHELFAADRTFRKWAAVQVSDHDDLPPDMESHTLTGGLYAVFTHSGPAAAFPATLSRFFEGWLPASGYELDHREHFEVLPEDWSATDPDAREEVWIPVRQRTAPG